MSGHPGFYEVESNASFQEEASIENATNNEGIEDLETKLDFTQDDQVIDDYMNKEEMPDITIQDEQSIVEDMNDPMQIEKEVKKMDFAENKLNAFGK